MDSPDPLLVPLTAAYEFCQDLKAQQYGPGYGYLAPNLQGQVSPDKVAGTHPTLQGATVNVTGAGETLKVNDAGLVCGGVKTANATVYMIDTVLMPPAN